MSPRPRRFTAQLTRAGQTRASRLGIARGVVIAGQAEAELVDATSWPCCSAVSAALALEGPGSSTFPSACRKAKDVLYLEVAGRCIPIAMEGAL